MSTQTSLASSDHPRRWRPSVHILDEPLQGAQTCPRTSLSFRPEIFVQERLFDQRSSNTPDSVALSLTSEKSPGPFSSQKLDRFAEEFALLVQKYPPTFGRAPAGWLARLPAEVFRYYNRGISSFGRSTQSNMEERGRLYLLHTALVLLWMRWGKDGTRRRLRKNTRKGVRRVARLVCLEHYRRGGVLVKYESREWFNAPNEGWSVSIRSNPVDVENVPIASLREAFEASPVVEITMDKLSLLAQEGAIPKRTDLPLESHTQ